MQIKIESEEDVETLMEWWTKSGIEWHEDQKVIFTVGGIDVLKKGWKSRMVGKVLNSVLIHAMEKSAKYHRINRDDLRRKKNVERIKSYRSERNKSKMVKGTSDSILYIVRGELLDKIGVLKLGISGVGLSRMAKLRKEYRTLKIEDVFRGETQIIMDLENDLKKLFCNVVLPNEKKMNGWTEFFYEDRLEEIMEFIKYKGKDGLIKKIERKDIGKRYLGYEKVEEKNLFGIQIKRSGSGVLNEEIVSLDVSLSDEISSIGVDENENYYIRFKSKMDWKDVIFNGDKSVCCGDVIYLSMAILNTIIKKYGEERVEFFETTYY